jgi:cupin superfamily acireductone dioxygenase involved in methionine salvage
MNTTPSPAPHLPATASRDDLVAFLRAHDATDHPARYRVNAAGLFNSVTGQLHSCNTQPLYDLLGVPSGAELAIGTTQVEVKQYILLRHGIG